MGITKLENQNLNDDSITSSKTTGMSVDSSKINAAITNDDISPSASLATTKLDTSSIPSSQFVKMNGTAGTIDTQGLDEATFNIGLLGFKMAVTEGLTIFNLVDGIVDEFNNEGGIDTTENSNAIYDSTSDFYTNQQLGPVPSPQRTTITSPTTYNVEPTIQTVNVLVVGGGGAGGGAGPSPANAFGGGGGAGGLIYYPGYPVTPGGSISVVIGAGGTGAENEYGGKGTDSSFGPLIGEGGGGGYDYASPYPDFTVFDSRVNGGSGGGPGNHPQFYNRPGEETQTDNHPIPISPAGTNAIDQSPNLNLGGSYGNDSGTASTYTGPSPGGSGNPGGGAGGGGAGEVGGNFQPSTPPSYQSLGGKGGDGLYYDIADGSTPIGYAGGGEAAGYGTDAARQAGVATTPQNFGAGLAGQEGTSSPSYNPWPQKPYFHAIETPNKFDGMDAIANRGSGGGGGHNHGQQPSGTGFGGDGGSGVVIVAEDTFLNSNTSMTLISDTFTATSTPSKARLVIFAEISDDLNTDINASVTRDNTTFNAVTLTDEGYQVGASGIKIFSGSTPLTGSASPQVQLRWKIVGSSMTGANKIHGVSLQWA